jgi:transcriptional regulator with XRE-family HTH domain
MRRELRADVLLIENIRSLLNARGDDQRALAQWCGHRAAWISKILSAERGVQTADLSKIADFFGLTVAELFQHGISPLTERRHAHRRSGGERRVLGDRRQSAEMHHGRLHPDVAATFPRRRRDDDSERAS